MGFVKNVATFGAAGRIDNKIEELDNLQLDYKLLYDQNGIKKKRC